jgi:hypothetical protein
VTGPTSRFIIGAGAPHVAGDLGPYKFEVFLQCVTAAESWNRAHEILTKPVPASPQAPILAALRAAGEIQSFLVAAGTLSDIFFPDDRGDKKRGKDMCELFDVADDSPLKDTKVRNAFVHIDERLDKWLPLQVGKSIGPITIEAWDGPAPPKELAQFMRIIDNKNWRVLSWGEQVPLHDLLVEINRIGQKYPLEWEGPSGRLTITFGDIEVEPGKAKQSS